MGLISHCPASFHSRFIHIIYPYTQSWIANFKLCTLPSSQIAASGSPIGLIKNAITSKTAPFCGAFSLFSCKRKASAISQTPNFLIWTADRNAPVNLQWLLLAPNQEVGCPVYFYFAYAGISPIYIMVTTVFSQSFFISISKIQNHSTPLILSTTVPFFSKTLQVSTGTIVQTSKLIPTANKSGSNGTENAIPR